MAKDEMLMRPGNVSPRGPDVPGLVDGAANLEIKERGQPPQPVLSAAAKFTRCYHFSRIRQAVVSPTAIFPPNFHLTLFYEHSVIMKLTAPFVLLVAAVGLAEASSSHLGRDLSDHAHHARVNHRQLGEHLNRRDQSKRCKQRPVGCLSDIIAGAFLK